VQFNAGPAAGATYARVAIPAALVFFMLWSDSGANPSADPRQGILINEGWSFVLEDAAGTHADGPRPRPWSAVDLPHTWNATDSRNKTKPYHRGTGRYRKTLFIGSHLAYKRLYLYFEGANQVADVTVNGEPAGRHVGGYSAFAFDISDLARFGEENEIEVRVDNRHDEDVPPLNADFTFYGGIYRDVRLLVLDDVHFGLDEYAATDLRVAPISVSQAQAQVEIDAGVENASGERHEVEVDSSLLDAEGSVIAQDSITATLEPGDLSKLRLARFEIREPELWSPESPYLYRVICTIRDGSRVLDRVQYPLGLRWVEVDAESGFRLNGNPYSLFGTNRHQDRAGLGNALPDELHRDDLRKIKNNGFNFLRLAHYPQDPAVLEAADEIGLLVWEETPVVNLIGLSSAFRQNSTRMVREMVRQHRHHPSVIFWGYMNEVTLVKPDPLPENYFEEVLALAKHLNGVVREEDSLRPTVMALSRDEVDNGVPLHEVPDILGLNLYFGWYYGELDSLGPFLDRYHQRNPGVPLFISEYGAGSDERVHALRPARFDFSTEFQQRFHEETFRQVLDRPWLIGSAVWAQFDFGSDYRQDTKFGINQKGLWYYDRTPKDIAWFYKAQLREEPILHIAARDWRHRAGSRPGDAIMPVRIYSNESPVELFVNGFSLGSKAVHNTAAVWDVEFAPGENVLTARSAAHEDKVTVDYEHRGSLFTGDSQPPGSLAVNAGADEQFVGADSRVWEADRAYVEGSWGYIGGTSERSHHRIFGTDDDPLYQTRRLGPHSYRFDVPDGGYLVGLRLAKLAGTPSDNEEFRVDINGRAVEVRDLEPFAQREIEVPVAASGGHGLAIRLISKSGDAFVNGIIVRLLPCQSSLAGTGPCTGISIRSSPKNRLPAKTSLISLMIRSRMPGTSICSLT
jgi:beta-galactosidase